MDKTITTRLAGGRIRRDLARENLTKVLKHLVKVHVVHSLVQILHEQVAHTRLADSGITASPNDAAGTTINLLVVQSFEGTLGIIFIVEVDIGVAKGFSCLRVTANTNGSNAVLSDAAEEVVQITLGDCGLQISNVQGSRTRSRSGDISHGGSRHRSLRSSHFFWFWGVFRNPC